MARRSETASKKASTRPAGMLISSYFTTPGQDPFCDIEWEVRTAQITDENGKVYFEQKDVEVPASWSQLATNVVVSKYFRGHVGSPERERSVKQIINRVADTITQWGIVGGYFASQDDAAAFERELKFLLVNQM